MLGDFLSILLIRRISYKSYPTIFLRNTRVDSFGQKKFCLLKSDIFWPKLFLFSQKLSFSAKNQFFSQNSPKMIFQHHMNFLKDKVKNKSFFKLVNKVISAVFCPGRLLAFGVLTNLSPPERIRGRVRLPKDDRGCTQGWVLFFG